MAVALPESPSKLQVTSNYSVSPTCKKPRFPFCLGCPYSPGPSYVYIYPGFYLGSAFWRPGLIFLTTVNPMYRDSRPSLMDVILVLETETHVLSSSQIGSGIQVHILGIWRAIIDHISNAPILPSELTVRRALQGYCDPVGYVRRSLPNLTKIPGKSCQIGLFVQQSRRLPG